jgi:cytochrome P450
MTDDALRDRVAALLAGAPEQLADPYAVYRDVRETARVFALDQPPVAMVTRYDDVRWAMRDQDRLSNRAMSEGRRVEAARASMEADALAAFDEVIGFQANFVSRNDHEDHARLRRAAHLAFTPRKIAELEQSALTYVDAMVAGMDGDTTVDLMDLAYRLPLAIMGDLLGVPESDRDMIHGWSLVLGASNASTEPEPFLAARAVVAEFRAYVEAMVAAQAGRPAGTDLVAALLGAADGDRLTTDELTAMFVQLLFAGHETTTNLIGLGLLELLRDHEQWEILCVDPARIPAAVEELLRWVSPSQFVSRLVVEDVELGGAVITAGSTLLVVTAAANRDPAVFDDPDRLDIRREPARHLAFGYGPHFCLGAALTRLEARIVLDALVRRLPDLVLAEQELDWRGGAMLRRCERVLARTA